MKMKRHLLLLTGLILLSYSCRDDKIELKNKIKNSSFEEGEAGLHTLPIGWHNCGEVDRSPPDLFESGVENDFNVNVIGDKGSKFVGLVVRSDGTRECMYQQLPQTIESGEYLIDLTVARSKRYTSIDLVTGDIVEYNQPVILQVIGIDEIGNEELFYSSVLIDSESWINLKYGFNINRSFKKIRVTPNYGQLDSIPYNGNVLIDEFKIEVR